MKNETNTTPPAPDRAIAAYRNEFVAALDASDARYAAAAAAAAEANAEYDAAGDKYRAACVPHLANLAAAKAAAEAECRAACADGGLLPAALRFLAAAEAECHAACAPHLADRRAARFAAADKYYAAIAALPDKPSA